MSKVLICVPTKSGLSEMLLSLFGKHEDKDLPAAAAKYCKLAEPPVNVTVVILMPFNFTPINTNNTLFFRC